MPRYSATVFVLVTHRRLDTQGASYAGSGAGSNRGPPGYVLLDRIRCRGVLIVASVPELIDMQGMEAL